MQNTLAWKFIYDKTLLLRESFVQKLVTGEEGADMNRRAIQVIDMIMKVPAKLVQEGKERRS